MYFNEYLGAESIDETNMEFIRNSVYKVFAPDSWFMETELNSHWQGLLGRFQKILWTSWRRLRRPFGDWFTSMLAIFLTRTQRLLAFEVDRRVVNITLSSFETELTSSDKMKLFPNFGELYPSGQVGLASCVNGEEFRNVIETLTPCFKIFSRFKSADFNAFDKVCQTRSLQPSHH